MYYVGIDLGGTNIAAALVNKNGEIIRKTSVPTFNERPYEEICKDMGMLAKKVIEDEGISLDEVKSIGVGSPGTPDSENGILIYTNNFKNFNNVPVRTEIQKYVDLPVYLENDANCAALGESVAGAGKGYKDCVAITLGTGVGGGVILDGKIVAGSFHGGAEIGHMVIRAGGEQCNCGRKGCFETYSSATALIREARIAAAKYPSCEINKLVNGDLSKMNAKIPFDAAQSGDEVAAEVIDSYIYYLAVGIANCINIFEPQVLVIGGGVCAQKDNLLIPLIGKVKNECYGNADLKTKITIAELGNDAGIIGAAMLGK